MPSLITADQLALTTQGIGAHLRAQHQLLAVAESCTGGGLGQYLTRFAGSSLWFAGGVISYSNALKQNLLQVPATLIQNHGAVSAECVLAMAAGALQCCQSDWAIAISGVAGPEGGSASKPVGTVYLAWQARGQAGRCAHFCFAGDREAVRAQAIAQAILGLSQELGLT